MLLVMVKCTGGTYSSPGFLVWYAVQGEVENFLVLLLLRVFT